MTPKSIQTRTYAAHSPDQPLTLHEIQRHEPRPNQLKMEIDYCGVCHSDIHQARNEWKNTVYPCVPGHEIVGTVTQVGDAVKKFKVGDTAAVGCMVDSCRTCAPCKDNLEQHCENFPTFTYNGEDRVTKENTYGGYSQRIVVDEHFVLNVPANLDKAGTAPLLCAGITTYSPLKRFHVGPGQRVGIVGLGGLGHMGVKFAAAFGAEVYVISRSPSKTNDALRLGAKGVILSTDKEQMKQFDRKLDFIIDTVSADHDINAYMNLLKLSGNICLVGAPENPLSVEAFSLVFMRRNFSGSLIGGIKETQEMLDFCGQHNIVSDIEMIRMDQINEAYERILKSDVKYRFVIDMKSLA